MSTPRPTAPKRLPVKPSEENLRKQAKRLARQENLALADAQHRLARDYGAKHWAELMHIVETMLRGADQLSYVKYDMEALPKAANSNDIHLVRTILASGEFTQHDLDLALARSVLSFDKRGEIARLLIGHGADPDGQYGSNYGPIVFVTGECLDVEGLEFLIAAGADVTFPPIDTKYGRQCPLSYWLGTYVRGQNAAKHRGIDILLKHNAFIPPEVSPPILAIHRGDAKRLGELIDADRSLLRKTFRDMPYGNISLAGATLLHCAVEFGEIDCIDAILSRYRDWGDLDMNSKAEVIDGIGGQTPIYHAINTNGDRNFHVLEHLVQRVGQYIDMSVKATWRSYGQPQTEPLTPLEYALKAEREMDPKQAHYKPRVKDEIALLVPLDRRATIRKATERGDIDTVRMMLDEYPELLAGELWPGAIHRAKSLELVKLLLDRGLDPNDCPAPRKPLHLAAYYSLADIIELLVERGADVNFRNPLREVPMDLIDAYEPRPIGDEQSRRSRDALLKGGATYDTHTAVRMGDIDMVRRMIDADPKAIDAADDGWHPLARAARGGRVEVARLLLDRGANVDGTTDKGNTPLWFACQSSANADDRIAVATMLLDHGADIHKRCEDGTNAIHFAAWRGPVEMVKLLLDHGARHWLGDDKGKTPADYARDSNVNPRKDAIVKLLSKIDYDDANFARAVAMIDAGDVEGLKQLLADHPYLVTMRVTDDSATTRAYFSQPTLLHFVANNPYRNKEMPPRILETTQVILDAGADVDAKTPHDMGGTTLALVASCEPARKADVQVPLIELLVRHGADPAAGLQGAIVHREIAAVEAMLRLGAKHTLVSAAGMGDSDTVRRLLKANPTDEEKQTAIWAAAINGRVGPVDTLLDAGIDINARLPRPFNPTILHEAAMHGHRRLVDRLLQRGADPTIRDKQYNGTPADWAFHAGGQEALSRHIREMTPMVAAITAIRRGDVDELKRRLADDPQLVATRLNGRTLLHILCDWPANMPRSSGSARALVAAGADVNSPLQREDDHPADTWAHNATPLHWAASSNDATELCRTLIDLGADINAVTDDDGTTPLTNAMHFNIPGAADVLLKAGAKDSLIIAAGLGDLERVKSFFNADDTLKAGAGDPPFKNADARRILAQAINFAAAHGHHHVIRHLAGRGAPLSEPDTFVKHFCTPLHRAALREDIPTMKLLLELGADPNATDPAFHATPLGWAEHNGCAKAAAFLKSIP